MIKKIPTENEIRKKRVKERKKEKICGGEEKRDNG